MAKEKSYKVVSLTLTPMQTWKEKVIAKNLSKKAADDKAYELSRKCDNEIDTITSYVVRES